MHGTLISITRRASLQATIHSDDLMRLKILIIVPPERFDFYDYLAAVRGVDFILLWHTDPEQMNFELKDLPLAFRQIVYWNQFKTPEQLIKKIKPDKIVFFEIIDLRQISLIVTAKKLRVQTFYLEHGAAGDKETAIMRWEETTFGKHKLPYFFNRIKSAFGDVLKSKLFYYSVRSEFSSLKSQLKYLTLPIKMLFDPPNKVLARTIFPERVPDRSIVFNRSNFDEYALYTGIKEIQATFSGVPFFDKYFTENRQINNHIVYVEQPYLEPKLLNWDDNHHRKIANAFYHFARETGIKVYIKLHPRSDYSLWSRYSFDSSLVEVIQFGEFTELYLSARLILGYSSSLIAALLCAKKNVVLLGWHPKPEIFGSDFSEKGLCHVSFYPEELSTKYASWTSHNLAEENEGAYYNFLFQFNYPFDGKATERVLSTILQYEVS
jgi:hypothetical protein